LALLANLIQNAFLKMEFCTDCASRRTIDARKSLTFYLIGEIEFIGF